LSNRFESLLVVHHLQKIRCRNSLMQREFLANRAMGTVDDRSICRAVWHQCGTVSGMLLAREAGAALRIECSIITT
jgi:hypothetical protein